MHKFSRPRAVLVVLAMALVLAACSDPVPDPDPDPLPDPQASALRDTIQAPIDKAKDVDATQAAEEAERQDALDDVGN